MEERRSSFRTTVKWPVEIITSQGTLKGEVIDISGTGVFLNCENPLDPEESCLLRIELPIGSTAELPAEVVWIKPFDSDQTAVQHGMGVRFLS